MEPAYPDTRARYGDYAERLAFATVARFPSFFSPPDHDDLLAAALWGAACALDRFRPEQGTRFSSFAITYIRGAILEEFRHWDPLTRRERKRVQAGEDPPLVVCSLDGCRFGEDDGDLEGELLVDPAPGPEEVTLNLIERERWQSAIRILPGEAREVVYRYYYHDEDCHQIGRALGCSQSNANRILKSGRRHLRQRMEATGEVTCG